MLSLEPGGGHEVDGDGGCGPVGSGGRRARGRGSSDAWRGGAASRDDGASRGGVAVGRGNACRNVDASGSGGASRDGGASRKRVRGAVDPRLGGAGQSRSDGRDER